MVDLSRFSECGLAEEGKEREYLGEILEGIESVLEGDKPEKLAKVMKALADPTRLRIVAMAKSRGKLYECEIVGAFDMAQPTASYHLRMLADAGVLMKKREGRMIAYMPSDSVNWKIAEMIFETSRKGL